ncbi:MAG: hypothetical protein L3J32_02880 [Rhizobiaceae bacterium]|nr:hypothetical protein [Rhizobiaceae bacterium]
MFYEVFAIFTTSPWLAAIPALLFFWMYNRFKLKVILYTALLWAVYLIYELGIYFGLLCDEDCNIRIDLFAIYPLLAVMSLLAIAWVVFSKLKKS